MNLSYCECSVKRADRKFKVLKYVWILAELYMFVFNLFWFPDLTFSIVILLTTGMLVIFWPNFSAEFEYVFCDGQIDFDIIRSGRKRKTLKKIDLIDADMICHIYSDKLKKYQSFDWKKSFVSGNNYANAYVIILKKGVNGYGKITFEPDEKMLECIKNKAPRITFIDKPALEED